MYVWEKGTEENSPASYEAIVAAFQSRTLKIVA